jgi:hypothetical protein
MKSVVMNFGVYFDKFRGSPQILRQSRFVDFVGVCKIIQKISFVVPSDDIPGVAPIWKTNHLPRIPECRLVQIWGHLRMILQSVNESNQKLYFFRFLGCSMKSRVSYMYRYVF